MPAMSRLVLWFRNDLRLLDNAAVHQCAKLVQSGQCKEVRPALRQFSSGCPWSGIE